MPAWYSMGSELRMSSQVDAVSPVQCAATAPVPRNEERVKMN